MKSDFKETTAVVLTRAHYNSRIEQASRDKATLRIQLHDKQIITFVFVEALLISIVFFVIMTLMLHQDVYQWIFLPFYFLFRLLICLAQTWKLRSKINKNDFYTNTLRVKLLNEVADMYLTSEIRK